MKDGLSRYCMECVRSELRRHSRKRRGDDPTRYNPPGGSRWCEVCKSIQRIENFGTKISNSDGVRNVCKVCMRVKAAAYRKKVALENTLNPPQVSIKRCSQCKEVKLASKFNKSIQANDGLHNYCIECNNHRQHDRYLKNKERHAELREAWKKNNLERHLAARSRYYKENKDHIKKYLEGYREANRLKLRGYTHARRAMLNGSYTASEFEALVFKSGSKCLACGTPGSPIALTVDHVLPVSKGGSNYARNLQPLCRACNSLKRAKFIDYRPWTMDSDEIGLGG